MAKFPTIESFFPPQAPISRARHAQSEILPGDGFVVEGENQVTLPADGVSHDSYPQHTIASLRLGMTKVSITGRIVNLWESNQTKSDSDGRSTKLFQLALRDDTGIIEFRIWLFSPFRSIPILSNIHIDRICSIYIQFVAGLDPVSFSKSNTTVPLFISVSEEDLSSKLVVHEDTRANSTLYKVPLTKPDGASICHLMPLQTFLNGELDAAGVQTLLCIKFIGARKKVSLKNGTSVEKVEVGVFDETAEGFLILWGALATCATNWQPSKTILLLTNPNVKLWSNKPQLTITRKSLLEVDPDIRDANWLREYSLRLLGRPVLQQEFPINAFDWEDRLSMSTKTLYTLGDIDQYSRQSSGDNHVGFMSVMLVDVKLTTLCKRNMLMCGVCCGDTIFSNTLNTPCKRCERVGRTFRLNPRILGTITDETGCVNGGNLLVSDKAWRSLFGRPAEELVNANIESLEEIEYRMLFTRVTLVFGWSSEIGKLAIWDIVY